MVLSSSFVNARNFKRRELTKYIHVLFQSLVNLFGGTLVERQRLCGRKRLRRDRWRETIGKIVDRMQIQFQIKYFPHHLIKLQAYNYQTQKKKNRGSFDQVLRVWES